MNLLNKINEIISIDILKEGDKEELFVGNPFYIDYESVRLLTCDYWKYKVKGIPKGCFLLAFYKGEAENENKEALLLRVINPTKLPMDDDIIATMIAYYKENKDISGREGSEKESKLDPYTRYELSFSGLECRILGVFYKDKNGKTKFGADIENYYAPNNYKVYKATGDVLKFIVNQGMKDFINNEEDTGIFKIGKVRYASTQRFQQEEDEVPVYISSKDFLGTRTALFGMTRTGKSNTVKMIIKAVKEISEKAINQDLPNDPIDLSIDDGQPFTKEGKPKYKVGQIIFDINGEYANPNLQDEGTAIYDIYKEDVVRYSVVEKKDFKVLKINFFEDIEAGFYLIKKFLEESGDNNDYIRSFLSINLNKPDDYEDDHSVKTRYDRKVAAYKCMLYRAGFQPSQDKIKFPGKEEINKLVRPDNPIKPDEGISYNDACIWFEEAWKNYNKWEIFNKYRNEKDKEYFDEDMQAILRMLTRMNKPGSNISSSNISISGFLKIRPMVKYHTNTSKESFEKEILKSLREGKIIIIDLSQGDEEIQKVYSERICEYIFNDSMRRFTELKPNNFIQFYFEEAHNLFPKKEDKDLSQIYNRIAKEGAKLNLGMVYATQEVSSISSNILKNTQNWFIAHLNNEDELKEIKKFYDFEDFLDSLKRFSVETDKGFVKMKLLSNPFVIPVQIDKFKKES